MRCMHISSFARERQAENGRLRGTVGHVGGRFAAAKGWNTYIPSTYSIDETAELNCFLLFR